MFSGRRHIDLTRRLSVCYLFALCLSLVWAVGGTLVAVQRGIEASAEATCLTSVRRASSRVALEYIRGGAARAQAFVHQWRPAGNARYCALVSPEGEVLAHSSPAEIGKAFHEPAGRLSALGDIERVEFSDDARRPVVEYRVPLGRGGERLPVLHVAIWKPRFWQLAAGVFGRWHFVFLGPAACLAAGLVLIRRAVRPTSAIESQLTRAAVAVCPAEMDLDYLEGSRPAALGWNRLVDVHRGRRERNPLEARVERGLEPFLARHSLDSLHSLPEGIALTDQSGAVTFANRAMESICGSTGDDQVLAGQTLEKALELQLQPEEVRTQFSAAAGSRTAVAQIKRSIAGSTQVLRVARHPLRAGDARSAGHLWAVRDVTQQQLAEEMRENFLQTASHELRTPLANIKAYAETLTMAELDLERQKQFCNIIESEATRLSRLIEELLSVSSMEAGGLSLDRQEVDTGRMFGEIVTKVKPQAEQKQINLELAYPEKWPKLHLDKDKMVTSFVNVLGNAVKYTPCGGRVALAVAVDDRALTATVRDSGIGISADDLPKLFEKFFRSNDPRVQEQAGSGLGLALVREVVRLHGGTIDIKSELNVGTTVTVVLPIS